MFIKWTKKHPSGFQVGAGSEVSDTFGARMVEEGFAEKVTKKSFEELPSNGSIVAKQKREADAKAKAEEKAKKAKNEPCADCAKKKNGSIDIIDETGTGEGTGE